MEVKFFFTYVNGWIWWYCKCMQLYQPHGFYGKLWEKKKLSRNMRFGIALTKNLKKKCTPLKTKQYFSWKWMVAEDEMSFWNGFIFADILSFSGVYIFYRGERVGIGTFLCFLSPNNTKDWWNTIHGCYKVGPYHWGEITPYKWPYKWASPMDPMGLIQTGILKKVGEHPKIWGKFKKCKGNILQCKPPACWFGAPPFHETHKLLPCHQSKFHEN